MKSLYIILIYALVLDHIGIEPMNNKKKGEMILAQTLALERMKTQGISLTQQLLKNKVSMAYRL